jgi:23S rRNA-/tRNA-specific pseudouridylate synthase
VYVAYVAGRPHTPAGTWRQWLQLSRDELRQHVLSATQLKESGGEAREAITHYEVIAEYPLARGQGVVTKLRLRLETGRKHQIRVQAAHAGLPLLGDRTYNPACRERDQARPAIDFPRQALHAEVLSLEHPDKPANAPHLTPWHPGQTKREERQHQRLRHSIPNRRSPVAASPERSDRPLPNTLHFFDNSSDPALEGRSLKAEITGNSFLPQSL